MRIGASAHDDTRQRAVDCVRRNQIGISRLSLADLDRLASLSAPRRLGLGELACAIIAERDGGGVLCDDMKAVTWLQAHVRVRWWESIEDVLLDCAHHPPAY